jgi:hypothetical protein
MLPASLERLPWPRGWLSLKHQFGELCVTYTVTCISREPCLADSALCSQPLNEER